MTEPDWAALEAAWQPARRAGVLGRATTETLIAHAAGYLPAACRVDEAFAGADLGTGAGVPGVILAALRPASTWTLIDGNERRCEFAQSAVRALGMGDRVSVLHARAEAVAHDVAHRAGYGLVVARAFGPPAELAECALPLVDVGGVLVVSVVAPTLRQWELAAPLLDAEVDETTGDDGGRFAMIRPRGPVPAAWPRRPAARRRAPLFSGTQA